MRQWCILIHQTDINLITISLIQIFYHSLGIFDTARQHQVAHDDTFFHHSAIVKLCFWLLSYHLCQSRLGNFRILGVGIDARTNVDAAEAPENHALVEKLNATAPENLAKAMKEVGGWLVQISTDYVFGKEPYNTPCQPEQQGTPTGIYGETKKSGEEKIKNVFANSTDTTGGYIIIRTAWLYSEYGKNFCKTMLNLTATKPQLKVVFDQCGTPTYALDLAKAIQAILEKPVQGTYHFSNEGVCSWYDFTQMIARIAGHKDCNIQPCYSSEYPSPVTRPSYSVLDKRNIRETFGIEIPYWVDSLEMCIANIKKQQTNGSN